MTTIVVLTKYQDIFTSFGASVRKYEPGARVVVVRDGVDVDVPRDWTLVPGHVQFSMAGNGNLGLRAVTEGDVLYCGDDIRFTQPGTITRLEEIAASDAELGILSPRIIGRGSAAQLGATARLQLIEPASLWFPCVFIKRAVFEAIGFLDERFDGFGSDDFDFATRAAKAGFKLGVTGEVAVVHGAGKAGGPTTFERALGQEEWKRQQGKAYKKFKEKWGGAS